MKTILGILMVCLLADAARAQYGGGMYNNRPRPNPVVRSAPTPQQMQEMAAAQAAEQAAATSNLTAQVQQYQKSFVPTDPWRIVNDTTNYARGTDWVQFEGRVMQVLPEGALVVQGWYGEPVSYLLADQTGAEKMTFVLSGFPRRLGVGQAFSRTDRMVAQKSGEKNSLPNLDYGTVYVPQLTEAQKAEIAQSKTKGDAKVLAFQQDLADKGDAYGEYKMGLRYSNGDGVTKDLQKARDLLGKAAEQGNKDAADALEKLPAN